MVKYKSPHRRLHGRLPPVGASAPPRRWKHLVLLAPPLMGALAAHGKYQEMKQEAARLNAEARRAEDAFVREYRRETTSLAVSMLNDPRYREIIDDLREGKSVKLDRFLKVGLDVVAEHPGYVPNLQARARRANERIEALEAEAERNEANASRSAWAAFESTTGIAYVIVAFAYIYLGAKSALSKLGRKSAAAELKERPKDDAGAPEAGNPPALAAQTPDARKTQLPEPPLAQVVDIRPVLKRAENDNAPPAGSRKERSARKSEKCGAIFMKDSGDEMLSRGFEPKEVERALIRGFKILSRNSMLLGANCAPSAGIHRDMKQVIGDEYRAAMVFALLEDEGLLLRHEDDCASLNPEPDGALGKLIMRDIQAHVSRMAGRNQAAG